MPSPSLHALPLPEGQRNAHLVVPFAASESEYWWPTLQGLPQSSTQHLKALLKGMRVVARDSRGLRSLTPPHERLLAEELGWDVKPDGLLPWAAWQRAQLSGTVPDGPWGWVTLCHWAMGREHATLSDPDALDLSEAESLALLESMRPFFEEDGIRLHALAPGRWLAEGQALAQPTASLDRVLGRNVDPWLPSAEGARLLRRLQNEMQMLLYNHPVNEARQQRRLLTANSVWFSGSGTLSRLPAKVSLTVARHLAQPALAEDWPGYAQAWKELDASAVRDLLERQRQGQTVRMSLCGERGSVTLETAPRGLVSRLKTLMNPPAWPGLLQGL